MGTPPLAKTIAAEWVWPLIQRDVRAVTTRLEQGGRTCDPAEITLMATCGYDSILTSFFSKIMRKF